MSQSKACCTIPPVISQGYEPKGKYVTFDGLKTYVTGPSDATRAILVIYDIFGFFPQTLQGADILAFSDKERPYQVFMPDWFEGSPADISWYPPDTPEKGKLLGEFFQTKAAPPTTLKRVPPVITEIKKVHTGIESWGILGYCWGGKITNLASQEGTRFKAAASCHPAMVDPKDAPGISIPFLMIPSKDEDKAAVAEWEKNLKVKAQVEWFDDQIHGFMAARSDLADENVKKQYERAYGLLLDFYHANL